MYYLIKERKADMYHVDIGNKGGYTFNVASGGYEFSIDMKGEVGITPPDTLLASLGTCVGVYVRKYAEGAGLDLKEFSISVDANFSAEKPICFRKINVSVDLKGAKIDEHRLARLVEFVKNCPVHHTLKSNPEIELNIK